MISYAVNHEDVLLARAFAGQREGFYVDVGAGDPVVHSLTKHFHDLGWRGINIEPGDAFERLARERPRDVNLRLGVSDASGRRTFYEFLHPEHGELSSFCRDEVQRHARFGLAPVERQVETRTLASILEEHSPAAIDFLSIDVEGHEREVLAGGDFHRWRPRLIVVEATRPLCRAPTHEAWEPILIDAGYVFAAFDGLNRYYTLPEESALAETLSVPVNVFDEYVPYDFQRRLERLCERHHAELREVLALYDGVGPDSLRVAQFVHRLAGRYPRLAHAGKRLGRVLSGGVSSAAAAAGFLRPPRQSRSTSR